MAMQPDEAAETLAALDALRRNTRGELGRPTFAMICLGGATVLSAAVVAAFGTIALLPYWVVVGIGASSAIQRNARRRGADAGIEEPAARWRIALVLFGGCLLIAVLAGTVSDARAAMAAPVAAVLLGYVVLGVVRRDAVLPLAVLPGAAAGVALAVTGAAPWLVFLVFGAALTLAGATLRVLTPAPVRRMGS